MTKPVRNYDLTKRAKDLAAKAARGEYELIEPLDTMILDLLPVQGSLFGGLYPLGETVQNLEQKFKGQVKITTISTRLRLLHIQGLAVKTNSVSEGRGSTVWQRTSAATNLLNNRKEKKG